MTKLSPDTTPLPPRQPPFWKRREGLVGIGSALLYALGVYVWTRWQAPNSGMLLLAFILGAPIAACVLAVRVADPRGERRGGSHVTTGAVTITLMLIAAGVILREGAVCLVMAAPVFYGTGLVAAYVTGKVLRRRPGRVLCLAVLAVPLLGGVVEKQGDDPAETRHVVSSIVIDAAPGAVWDRLVDVRTIGSGEHHWNFTHDIVGVPRPVDARMEGSGVGAVRHLTWAKGVKFEEHIIDWRPGQALAWTFEVGPEASTRMLDEHLRVNSAYLRLEEGRYTIEPLADGRTRLVLDTRYWMKTPINDYAGWWGGIFLGDFHRNVLGVIKARAEA
ncbi:MAG: SRPBCC family protein [Caulobacteraceae bacterium]|nr:SRPBCC family protein [Caulobacteraceae bacterium]